MKAMSIIPTVRRRRQRGASPAFSGDAMTKLYELLEGKRERVHLHSKTLGCDLCFVNPTSEKTFDAGGNGSTVYTTRELSFVLSLSPADLRRYHYLKTQLI